MSAHLLRLDFSAAGTDFEPTALEPGVPMLDRAGSNYAVLRGWLGSAVAEPVWEGADRWRYSVRDEQQGRPARTESRPATYGELAGTYRKRIEQWRERLAAVRPSSARERLLLEAARRALEAVDEQDGGSEGSFVSYREPSGSWRLIWCWGYRRKDRRPAVAVICPTPECRRLLVKGIGESGRCPTCSPAAAVGLGRRRLRRRLLAATCVLLPLTALGLDRAGLVDLGIRRLWGGGQVAAAIPAEAPMVPERKAGDLRVMNAVLRPAANEGLDAAADWTDDLPPAPPEGETATANTDELATAEVPAVEGANPSAATPALATSGTATNLPTASLPTTSLPTAGSQTTAKASVSPSTVAKGPFATSTPALAVAGGASAATTVGKTTGVAVPKVAVSGAIPRTGTYTPTGSRTAGAIARPGTVYGSSRTSGYGTGGYRTGSYGTGGYGKGIYGSGIYGHGLYGAGLYGDGLYGTSVYGNGRYGVGGVLTNGALGGYVAGGRGVVGSYGVGPYLAAPLASTAVGGTYVGPGLLHRDGSVVVSDWPTDSLLRGSRVVPGSVILGVNGAPYVSSTGTGTYTPARDLAFGDVIEYRTPQGTVERTTLTSVAAPTPLPTPAPVSVSPNVEVRYDVRLLGVRALEVSASYFRPEVRIETAQAGDYRLVDSRGAAISPWSGLGAGSTADLIGGAVPRAAGDAYELFVERRRGDEIRRYQAAFQLSGAGN